MKRFFKSLVLFMVVMGLTGTMALAASYTDHVKIAPNGKGDMLLFPWYIADASGWETKLTVTNTDQVYSVVAKLVVRESFNSKELLDFLIYLSPADVWTGTLRYDAATQRYVMFSDDDSVLNTAGTAFVTAASTFTAPLANFPNFNSGFGYVDVFESTAFAIGSPVSKDRVLAQYGTYNVLTKPPTRNVLSGKMEVKFPLGGISTILNATTLADYRNLEMLSVRDTTWFGSGTNNSPAEIEAVLAKDFVAMPVIKDAGKSYTIHFFSFPSKNTDIGYIFSPFFRANTPDGSKVEYFADIFDRSETRKPISSAAVSPFIFNRTYLPYEVNMIYSSIQERDKDNKLVDYFPYPEGWANYNFEKTSGTSDTTLWSRYTTASTTLNGSLLRYTGAPVICTYLIFGANGVFEAGYPAWTDSTVIGDLIPGGPTDVLTDYTYTNNLPN